MNMFRLSQQRNVVLQKQASMIIPSRLTQRLASKEVLKSRNVELLPSGCHSELKLLNWKVSGLCLTLSPVEASALVASASTWKGLSPD